MQASKGNQRINAGAAQLQHVLDKCMISTKYNAEWFFGRMNDINDKVVSTEYLDSLHPEWIGCTTLHFAAMKKNSDAFAILLDLGADFTIKNRLESTALHQVIEDLGTETLGANTLDNTFVYSVISAHLKNSNFANPFNKNGLSHFHIACAANNVEAVKGFLQNGVLVNHTVRADCSLFPGYSPLHFAAKYCAFEVAEVLSSHGASMHVKDAKGMTPLHVALDRKLKIMSEVPLDESVKDRNEKILKSFLENESCDDMMIIDDWGLSHFHKVCALSDSKVAESYLQKIININHAVNMDSPMWAGYTALHFAALCNIDSFKLLMKKGADISLKDAKGVTPFDLCIERYKAQDIYAILSLHPIWKNIMLSDGRTKLTDLVFAMRSSSQFEMFLKKLSKNFSIYDSLLWPGYTPMHLAVTFCKKISKRSKKDVEEVNLQIFRILFEHNPSMLHTQDVHGYTPLHLAFRLNKKVVLSTLLQFYESCPKLVDRVDEDGLSYVHIASAKNKANLLQRLLPAGGNINAVYKGNSLITPTLYSGSTALHLAIANGSTEAVEILKKYGADVHAKDANDMTPIHFALSSVKKKSIDILLKTPHLQDSVVSGIGLSHLHVACLRGKQNLVERLLDNGADVNGVVAYQNGASGQLSFLEKYAGHSPLLFALVFALKEDRGTLVKLLLQRGADMFIRSSGGMALLYNVLQESDHDHFLRRSESFVNVVKDSDELKARLQVDIGMTKLHVACLDIDVDVIKTLISEGADVNAQIHADSPILKGYTPLHVVMHLCDNYDDEDLDEAIELLVKAGADVTLPAVKAGTVVHMAWESSSSDIDDTDDPYYQRVKTLVKAQRDFSVNPVNVGGFSHFHVACSLCDIGVVQKFLDHADVDVNQPMDFFYDDAPGYTALHLASNNVSESDVYSGQLDTIDLLLKHGADADAKDADGDTSLHESVLLRSLDVFERMVRSGADVNARNSCGETPLHCFLESGEVSAEKIRILLRYGCHLNAFNPITEKCYLGLAVGKLPHADSYSLLSAMIINFEHEMKIDHRGCTPIHNIVSVNLPEIGALLYPLLIEKLASIDCDVDSQDNLGRTALHMAVKFHNFKAASALLTAGADLNITDKSDKTAFAYYDDRCILCKTSNESSDDEPEEDCSIRMLETLAVHVKKLQMCGLDVNKQNGDLACKAFEKLKDNTLFKERFFEELETIKKVTIGSHPLSLYDFMSENGAVADYPMMSQLKRHDIIEFFSRSELKSFIQLKFPETTEIAQLQYRKARARPQLVECAKNAMALLIGFRLPEICSHIILVLLSNSELKNLVASTTV